MAAGLDEVGRGALAGPLVVAACSLGGEDPERLVASLLAATGLKRLADSKRLSAKRREQVAGLTTHLDIGIGRAEAAEIDALGLTAATVLAAGRALDILAKRPDKVIADAGLRHPYEEEMPTERFVKGDERFLEIMLASIHAKVYRDGLMTGLDPVYPAYGFARHVGYGTAAHFAAIREYGLTPEHRRSFLKLPEGDGLWQ